MRHCVVMAQIRYRIMKIEITFDRVKNLVAKGEIIDFEQFLLFPKRFSRVTISQRFFERKTNSQLVVLETE